MEELKATLPLGYTATKQTYSWDYSKAKRQYGRNLLKAVAGKATPILLTVLSTCYGLIPFIMEGQNEIFWFSLAIGAGLIFSVIGVFWALPVFLWQKSKHKAVT